MFYNIYGVSDWPETDGELFPIFLNKFFQCRQEAIDLAKKVYDNSVELVIKPA